MAQVKAKLKIVLTADDVVVAETEDPILWQRVLVAINSKGLGRESSNVDTSNTGDDGMSSIDDTPDTSLETTEFVAKLSGLLGLDADIVTGACSPSLETPYLRLDHHSWEAMKKQTGERGPNSISPIALASTLLALWFRIANLGSATQKAAQGVLKTIGARDQNAHRGLKSADWLQMRSGGVVVINPAKNSKAISIAKSYCSENWKSDSTKE